MANQDLADKLDNEVHKDSVNKWLDDTQNADSKISEGGAAVQGTVFSQPVDYRGTQVHVKCWVQSDSELPPLVLVHEMGENHSGYRQLAVNLVSRGFSLFTYDQRGHGRSGRMLGHVDSFNEFSDDLIQIAAWTRYKCNRRKPVIIAHGIGAVVATRFLHKMPELCEKVVFIAPGFDVHIGLIKRFLVRALAEIRPRGHLVKKLTPQAILTPRSKMAKVTARFAEQVIQAIDQLPEQLLGLTTPILAIVPHKRSRYEYGELERLWPKSMLSTRSISFDFRHSDLCRELDDESTIERISEEILRFCSTKEAPIGPHDDLNACPGFDRELELT